MTKFYWDSDEQLYKINMSHYTGPTVHKRVATTEELMHIIAHNLNRIAESLTFIAAPQQKVHKMPKPSSKHSSSEPLPDFDDFSYLADKEEEDEEI